jgi:hypothetical protein
MGLREQVAYAISHGRLTQSNTEETAADLIGALAMADPLGAALWRVTGNLDPVAFRRARHLLFDKLHNEHLDVRISLMQGVCQQAMEEWLACLCPACNGRAFVTSAEGVRSTCPECHGTGRGRSSDDERMKKLHIGAASYSKLVVVLDEAHTILNSADRKVARQISKQLERKVPFPKAK